MGSARGAVREWCNGPKEVIVSQNPSPESPEPFGSPSTPSSGGEPEYPNPFSENSGSTGSASWQASDAGPSPYGSYERGAGYQGQTGGPGAPAGGGPYPRYVGAAPPPLSPQEERTWGMAAHGISLAAMLFSAGVLGFVGALVIYLIYRDRGPYVRSQTAAALNIQIAVAIGSVLSYLLMVVLIGFFTIVVVFIAGIVLHIIGLVKSSNGEWWNPGIIPRFVR